MGVWVFSSSVQEVEVSGAGDGATQVELGTMDGTDDMLVSRFPHVRRSKHEYIQHIQAGFQ
jgi:hypothetical protein